MHVNQIRLRRERHTIQLMIESYCRGQHQPMANLCTGCQALLAYAMQRIDKCPYQSDKPTCAKCPIHCYKPALREQVRRVMRYAGPRMMIRHPLLAILHSVDEIANPKQAKEWKKGKRTEQRP